MVVPNNALKTPTLMNDIEIFWTTLIGLPILAACVTLAIPSVRQKIKQDYKRWRTPLEQRYAKEIAAGDVVIVEPLPRKVAIKKLSMIFLGILVFAPPLILCLDSLNALKADCQTVAGISAVLLRELLSTFFILLNFSGLFWAAVTNASQSAADGFQPSRQNRPYFFRRISTKLVQGQLPTRSTQIKAFIGLLAMILGVTIWGLYHQAGQSWDWDNGMQQQCLLQLQDAASTQR